LWTNTVAFQKLQRLAHGDISEDEYVDYVLAQKGKTTRAFCLYASDAEIFDFRPGRYRTEEALQSASEWKRIAEALSRLKAQPGFRLAAPNSVFRIDDVARRPALRLESAACPVPVKKQRKYNLSRWAVTGRDDIAINAACERIYRALVEADSADDSDWKELCYLWSSDSAHTSPRADGNTTARVLRGPKRAGKRQQKCTALTSMPPAAAHALHTCRERQPRFIRKRRRSRATSQSKRRL
jgi:hypothetical protein